MDVGMPDSQIELVEEDMSAEDEKQEQNMYKAGYARVMPFLFLVCKYHIVARLGISASFVALSFDHLMNHSWVF
jgi:hypothetical protein